MGSAAGAVPVAGVPLSSPGSKPMPHLGMGAAAWPLVGSGNVKNAVLVAIKLGYRHFDTATIYQTESSLGDAFAEAIRLGLVKSRDDLFVTTKLWCSDAHPDRVESALRKSLQDLQLDYLDLYLIHWPVSSKPGKWEYPIREEELLPLDMEGVWKAMEQCHRLGLARAIGVSNFSCSKLEKLLSFAEIPPAVNQVEMNPVWRQQQLREFCAARGVHLTAYSPLGGKGTPWGSGQVMDSPVLREIAETKGKSLAQVCLRWAYEQGVTVLVKSFNERRLEENLDIFDWELDEADNRKIGRIAQVRGCRGEEFVSSTGPVKSTAELWDGES